jgi:hypothetical protein
MSITVSWYNEDKTIILRQMQGDWTWEEFHNSQSQVNAMLKEVKHTVDQIIDTSKSSSIPPSALTHFRAANNNVPPNAGTRVVIGTNAFYEMMFKILRNIFPRVTDNVILVPNMDAALAQIAEKQLKREKQ